MKPQSFFSSQMLYRKKFEIFFTNPLPKTTRKDIFLHKSFTELVTTAFIFFQSTIFRRRLIHPELKLQAEHHPTIYPQLDFPDDH